MIAPPQPSVTLARGRHRRPVGNARLHILTPTAATAIIAVVDLVIILAVLWLTGWLS